MLLQHGGEDLPSGSVIQRPEVDGTLWASESEELLPIGAYTEQVVPPALVR
jgi:hypothetical protein